MNGWPRVGPSDARHWHCCLLRLYAQFEHIGGRKQPALSRRLGSLPSYPHSEQIRYSMGPGELRVPKSGAAMQKDRSVGSQYFVGAVGQATLPIGSAALISRRRIRILPMTQIVRRGALLTWRTPAVIILCGCLISLIGFGPRSTFGFFLTPMSAANGWGRDVFALAFALQNLLWGIGQPFAGAVADRFGMVRVLSVGAHALRGRPRPDGLHDLAGDAAGHRRRADRLRPLGLLVQSGDRGVRQAPARALPHAGDRRRHRGRLVRPVPVRAVRRRR